MIRIEESIYFYLLLIVPILIGLFYYYLQHSKKLYTYFSVDEDKIQLEIKKLNRKFLFFSIGIILLCLSITNPQFGYRKEKVERTSADIFLAIDISQSMLSEDLSPSRLDRAKKIGERLINELKTERIGLIFFAGEAYLQMPLTTDYKTAIVFLRNASTQQAGVQGTAIGDAIAMAAKRDEDDLDQAGRMLIVITDGEDHEGEAAMKAKEAFNTGTTVFTVGVGTEDGSFIPIKHDNRDDYLRDKNGQPVRTKLNTGDLKTIAQNGGGLYFDHHIGNRMYREVKEKVRRMERRNFEKTLFTARESYFQWFLFPGLIMLALPFLMPVFRRQKRQISD